MFDDIGVGITFVMKNYEETKGKISGLQKALEGVEKSKVEKPLKEASKNTSNFNKNMKSVLTNVKKLGFALLTVRGVWFAIRKAMTTYLSQNDELKNKLEGIYYALGSLFAPVLETMVGWLIKAIGYIDVLAKALGFAGINMANFGKSSDKSKKSLAGFDEINNIDNGSSSSGMENPFANLQLDDKIVNNLKEIGGYIKENIFPIIKDIWSYVEPVIKYVLENLPTIAKLIGIVWAEVNILDITGKIVDFIKLLSTNPLTKLIVGVTTFVVGLTVAVKAFVDMWKNGWSLIGEIFKDLGIALMAVGAIILGAPAMITLVIAGIVAVLSSLVIVVKDNWDTIVTWTTEKVNKIKNKFNEIWNNLRSGVAEIRNNIENKAEEIKSGLTNVFESIKEKARTSLQSIKTFINTYVVNPINKVIDWVNSKLRFDYSGLSILGKQVIPPFSTQLFTIEHINQLATGTNYVPNDQLAMIHQGEAVIPKEFNSKEYFNNDETNYLLETLIQRVDNLEINPYITVRDIGQASVKYINQQSRVLGSTLV